MGETNWFDLARSEGMYGNSHFSPENDTDDLEEELPDWFAMAKDAGFYDKPEPKPKVDAVTVGNVIFRKIPSLEYFYISRIGTVINEYKKKITSNATSNGSQVRLQVGSRPKNLYRHLLVWEAWPEEAPKPDGDGLRWRGKTYYPVSGWPGYLISKDGAVIREKNWTLLTCTDGRYNLSKGGKQYGRARNRLLFETFNMS